jgi:hypothetical protein
MEKMTRTFCTDCDTCGEIGICSEVDGGGTICGSCERAAQPAATPEPVNAWYIEEDDKMVAYTSKEQWLDRLEEIFAA